MVLKLLDLAQTQGMRLGLSNMRLLDEAFDYPSTSFASIHVGGTNGKGSTTLKIASSLSRKRRVGLYTSPHISTLRERIIIDGTMIAHEEMEFFLKKIFKVTDQKKITPTFFEVLTMLAFLYFREKQVDVAVIEVGMGGRLDATNIITPLLSIITSISIDHTAHLGKNVEEIAIEKGGIIKENIPLLLGPQASNKKILHRLAAKKNSPCYVIKGHFEDFEQENRGIAKKALDILGWDIYSYDGLENTPPCRFEVFVENNNSIILDVAHNPAALEALVVRLEGHFPGKQAFLIAFSSDKEVEAMLELLIKKASFLYLTKASHTRALAPSLVAEYLKKRGYYAYIVEEDIKKCFERGRREEVLVVTGTFYIMKEVRQALNIEEEKDSVVYPF